MTDDQKQPDLPTRLRQYAELHDDLALHETDGEQRQWALDLLQAADLLEMAFRDSEVLVALSRLEGYEVVHPELLAEDAISPNWPEYRVVWPTEWAESD